MLIRNLLAAFLILIAGLASGIMHNLQFGYPNTVFAEKTFNQQFWNPGQSWKNKFKNGDPKQGEAFNGSTTVFAFTTDAWNLLKFVLIGAMMVAVLVFLPFSQAQGHERAEVWLLNFLSMVWLVGAFYVGSVSGSLLA